MSLKSAPTQVEHYETLSRKLIQSLMHNSIEEILTELAIRVGREFELNAVDAIGVVCTSPLINLALESGEVVSSSIDQLTESLFHEIRSAG